MAKRTFVLVVLDGFGIGANNESNPIYVANPSNLKWLGENYPLTSLQASGISVGLPWGEVGNSEVGHLTIGAGKVVYQYYPKITMAIEDGSFFDNQVLKDACTHAKSHGSAINFAGLLTKANVHASITHLQKLIEMAKREGVPKIKLHLFTDGKDSPPRSVFEMLKEIPRELIASISGRHYAMNRSESWSLTEKAYRAMTGQSGEIVADPEPAIQELYKKNMTEEFLPPCRMGAGDGIVDGDALVFFNFREDSILQIASAFAIPGFSSFALKPLPNLFVATFTRYSDTIPCPVAFPADTVEKPLGQIISEKGFSQLRLAETYKHAHVTFFFNGHREEPYPGEYRVLIPSLPTTHPEEHPELMAPAITDRLLEAIESKGFDFILVNYSNPDTIAHTGNYDACLKAVLAIDTEIGRILKAVVATDATLIITSDHGNMEEVISPVTGELETQHDASPVPFYLVSEEFKGRKFFNYSNLLHETTGVLSDIAPTLLELMHIEKPIEMNGRSLLKDLLH